MTGFCGSSSLRAFVPIGLHSLARRRLGGLDILSAFVRVRRRLTYDSCISAASEFTPSKVEGPSACPGLRLVPRSSLTYIASAT